MKSRIKVSLAQLIGIIAIAVIFASTMTACNVNKAGSALNEYEKFLNDVESAVKKMKAGDASAQADFAKLGERLENWSDEWDDISMEDLSLLQKAKFMELSVRATAVMAEYALLQYGFQR